MAIFAVPLALHLPIDDPWLLAPVAFVAGAFIAPAMTAVSLLVARDRAAAGTRPRRSRGRRPRSSPGSAPAWRSRGALVERNGAPSAFALRRAAQRAAPRACARAAVAIACGVDRDALAQHRLQHLAGAVLRQLVAQRVGARALEARDLGEAQRVERASKRARAASSPARRAARRTRRPPRPTPDAGGRRRRPRARRDGAAAPPRPRAGRCSSRR